jgi:hypothetical protein
MIPVINPVSLLFFFHILNLRRGDEFRGKVSALFLRLVR